MSEINCPVCGTPCKIVANPTIHYEPIAHSTLLAECEGLKAKLAKMKEAGSKEKIATIICKFFGLVKVDPKTDIYKDITIAKTAEKIVNWHITYGLAHAIAEAINADNTKGAQK